MPQDSCSLTDRSEELNRRSETLRGQSDSLKNQPAALTNISSLSIQEQTHTVRPSPHDESKIVILSKSERKVLHSWKEIAAYMGLGVRTVQRYERFWGLPIRRFAGCSVSAFTDELDRWMQTAGTQPIGHAEWEKLIKEIEELRSEVAHLRRITEELNKRPKSDGMDERSRKPRMDNRSELRSAS